jgi:hypothetical protein
MSPTALIRLNQRLGDMLGMVASGTLPRFAWKHSSEMPMVEERIGPRWLLTEWRRPSMSPAQWAANSGGKHPYPASGWYHPYYETALPIGLEPTADLTQKAIYQFDKQMSTTYESQLLTANNEIEAERGYRANPHGGYDRLSREEDNSTDRKEWIDRVQGSDEAFCNPLVGRTAFPQFMGKKASEGFVGI